MKEGGESMAINAPSKIGQMIRDARLRKGWTQTELATRLNVKQGTVGCWEIDRAFPRPGTLVRLSDLLEIPIDKLLKKAG